MNTVRRRSNRQGKQPTISHGDRYQQTLESLLADGARMAGSDPVQVAAILQEHGIDAVFIGGLVVGCHTGRPRTTQDIDAIINTETVTKKILTQLGKVVGASTIERHPSFVSLVKKTPTGAREVLDLITSKAGSYRLVFDHCQTLHLGTVAIKIPTLDMMLVLKYTAAVNPIRTRSKQLQDWSDIYAMADANLRLDYRRITELGNLVVPGFGDDLVAKLRHHRTGVG